MTAALFGPTLGVAGGWNQTAVKRWEPHRALVLFDPAPVARSAVDGSLPGCRCKNLLPGLLGLFQFAEKRVDRVHIGWLRSVLL